MYKSYLWNMAPLSNQSLHTKRWWVPIIYSPFPLRYKKNCNWGLSTATAEKCSQLEGDRKIIHGWTTVDMNPIMQDLCGGISKLGKTRMTFCCYHLLPVGLVTSFVLHGMENCQTILVPQFSNETYRVVKWGTVSIGKSECLALQGCIILPYSCSWTLGPGRHGEAQSWWPVPGLPLYYACHDLMVLQNSSLER